MSQAGMTTVSLSSHCGCDATGLIVCIIPFKPFAQPRPVDEIPALHFTSLRDFRTTSAPAFAGSVQQQEAQQQQEHTTAKTGPSSSTSRQPQASGAADPQSDQQTPSAARRAQPNQKDPQPLDQPASQSNPGPSIAKQSFFGKIKQCFKPSQAFSEANSRPAQSTLVEKNAPEDAMQPSPPAAAATSEQTKGSEREEAAAAKATVSDKAAKAGVAVKKWWMNSHTPAEQRPVTWPEY